MDTREQILMTGFRLFVKKGYPNVSINDVIGEIGLTKGGFYHHFRSKDELFTEALETFIFSNFDKYMGNDSLPDMDTRNILEYIFISLQDFYADAIKLTGDIEFSGFYTLIFQGLERFDFILKRMYSIYERIMQTLLQVLKSGIAKGEIRPDIDTHATAFQIVSLLEGMILMWTLNKNIDLKKEGMSAFKNYWYMLQKR